MQAEARIESLRLVVSPDKHSLGSEHEEQHQLSNFIPDSWGGLHIPRARGVKVQKTGPRCSARGGQKSAHLVRSRSEVDRCFRLRLRMNATGGCAQPNIFLFISHSVRFGEARLSDNQTKETVERSNLAGFTRRERLFLGWARRQGYR